MSASGAGTAQDAALRQRRALAVFDAALDVDDDARAAFIEAQCAGDAALAQDVHGLLAAAGMGKGILDVPPPGGRIRSAHRRTRGTRGRIRRRA